MRRIISGGLMLVLRSVKEFLRKHSMILLPADVVADLYMLLPDNKEFFYVLGRSFFKLFPWKNLGEYLNFLYRSGWGKFEIIWFSEYRILIKGISILAKQLRKYYGIQNTPVDDFILGILDSWAEENGLKMRFKEIECIAVGSDRCVFVGEIIRRPKHSLVELQQRIRGEII